MAIGDNKENWDVFISYSREDDRRQPFVERLRQDLEAAGKKVWWDASNMESRGRSFHAELRDAIWNSDRLIAVIGPDALQSAYVQQEWAYAYHFSKAIVPILRRGKRSAISWKDAKTLRRDELETFPDRVESSELRSLHCPDFRDDAKYEQSLTELMRILNADLLPLAPMIGDSEKQPEFPPPNYISRRHVLERLERLPLVDPEDPRSFWREQRIIVIHGAGGSGKSVAANAIAHAMQTRWMFVDGIIWLGIGRPTSTEGSLADNVNVFSALLELGRALGQDVSDYHDIRGAMQLLNSLLANKRCLLILDDVWDSVDAHYFVKIMGRGCSMIITTRSKSIRSELGIPAPQTASLGDTDLLLSEEEAKQLLADWAGQSAVSLPAEADDVVKFCGRLPLAIAICGALIGNRFPLARLPNALREAKEQVVKIKIPNFTKQAISVFTPIQVSLDYLKALDDADLREGRAPLERFKQYLDLAVLRGDVRTPENVINALWIARRNTDEDVAYRLLGDLDAWALLHLVGEQPYAYVLMHQLQTAYLQKVIDQKEHEILHREFGRVLFQTWRTGTLLGQRDLEQKERDREEIYCRKFLLQHLVDGKCWKELEQLMQSSDFLKSRQEKEAQYLLETGIEKLLRNTDAPHGRLLSSAWKAITQQMKLGKEQADWLDTFAYWLNKYGKEGGHWLSKEIRDAALRFDISCAKVSRRLVREYLNENRQDHALRFAELSAWAYQRAGNFEACAKACKKGERTCAVEGLAEGYRVLGKAEFMRMRAHALMAFANSKSGDKKKTGLAKANRVYKRLSKFFSEIGARHWSLNNKEWQQLEEDTGVGFDLVHLKQPDPSCVFRAAVVSNAHDALSAMYIIQFLEEKGGCADWVHHNDFSADYLVNNRCLFAVLIGGPKAPGISDVADQFLNEDREGYLRMYSGLYFGANILKANVNGTPCFMLGGVSKAHTLLAAFNWVEHQELDEILKRH